MVLAMVRQFLWAALMLLCSFGITQGDTIQLKEKAAISGTILAEKKDQVAVDVGYTVLVIPRNEISKISKSDEAPPKQAPPSKRSTPSADKESATPPKTGLYSSSSKPAPVRSVRDLVNILGEAVVQ